MVFFTYEGDPTTWQTHEQMLEAYRPAASGKWTNRAGCLLESASKASRPASAGTLGGNNRPGRGSSGLAAVAGGAGLLLHHSHRDPQVALRMRLRELIATRVLFN